ncbi:actin remodeling regulator NHS isoform X2 [Cololabis saira]|uniref:actin remodeling regulator NHS isoform X2 n=1 Tax=Cololabis saira TaxID=129043 RepID=UPI002AD55A35|nr:actin remodeling regulator NHS isoform X2 [Cololabis saira]
MPFAKRVVEPQLLCRYRVPNEEGAVFEDLVSISNAALSRSLRQLSDLARHACSIFQELERDLASTQQRVRGLQGKISRLQHGCSELDPKQEAVPVSNLDVESKLTTHFQAPWHQQRNIFHPSTRPACIEELHRRANLSLWALSQDPQRRPSGRKERRVTISDLPPMPLYPSPQIARKQEKRASSLATPEKHFRDASTQLAQAEAAPSDPDTDGVALGHRSKFPIPNIPSTLDKQTNWSKALPLPTPEERMKTNSQVITSCVIPINVTGLGFDRDASVRCSLVHSQSVLQRRRKLRRRRTVAGVPRQVQRDLESDDSPGSRERTVIVHAGADITPSSEELAGHLNTRDSGCQTEDFLVSGAPSRRKIRVQRAQGVSLLLSHSAGNISALPECSDAMYSASVGARLRSRSLPRDASRTMDNGHNDSENEEELSLFNTEGFLCGRRTMILKDEEESTDDQAVSEHQLGSLKYKQLLERPERSWMERTRAQLPRKADMGSCEISSSSDTFSSPVHSVSAAGVLASQMDHKEDHQSSSGNWSGSSSTCPSQTSETIPPAASPPLTGSSHCDSELSLNAGPHAVDDQSVFLLDHYHGLRAQRAGSFSSTAMDILEEAGVSTPVEGEWGYPHAEPSRPQGFSPEPSREADSSLGCPSFTSMATCESSFSDKPPSEKADSVSHYSVDTEGYYTSMHFDCGLKGSRSFTYNYAPPGPDCSLSDLSGHLTLGRRCLSLRKPKARPSPPKRSSSLRKICSEGNIPDKKEPKISCGQQLPSSSRERRLQLALSGPRAHMENSSVAREPFATWGATDLPDLGGGSFPDAQSFKDEGAVQSDYADLWLLNDLKSSDPYRSLSNSSTATGTTVIECIKSQESSESQTSQSGSRATTPSLPSVEGEFKLASPDKLAGLASPSSGYSSQSETPTSTFPSTFFPGPLSPASGKRKPKVPERKSSLSSRSLQSPSCKDGATSDRELELPTIPPSHLDLSALHCESNTASVFRTQLQNLQQNKQNSALTAKSLAPPQSEAIGAPLLITPSVLSSVQLRSVSKEHKDGNEDKAGFRLQSNGGITSKLPSSPFLELKGSHLHNSHHHHTSSTGSRDSVRSSDREPTSETRNKQDPEAPSESLCAELPLPDPCSDRSRADSPERPNTDEEKTCRESAETSTCSEDWSSHSEPFLQPRAEASEEDACPSPPVLHSSPKRSNSPDKVPATDGLLETSRDSDSSGVSAESASPDGKDESTAEAEEDFGKDLSASDNSASPLLDESRPEDDNVFVSPSKSRTTEDLFAMIHRSKRKVLGRKDSCESPGVRNRLPAASSNTPPTSAPVSPAPPSPAVTPPALHRVSGPIYRNAKKSSTSNEEFKLLLLKKGSRSDSSYRMSATEILKSPVTPKSAGDFLTESPRAAEEPAGLLQQLQQLQPGPDHLSSPYPRANAESFSPKPFLTSAASRQGRPRIPPPANSSRYSARSRLFSAPMQAISEGEAENSDGSPHDDRSSQGST